jgi:phytanoyl-CoA hydroxylase
MPTSDDQRAFFDENGYLLLEHVFGPDELDAMRSAVDGIVSRAAGTTFDMNHTWRGEDLDDEPLREVVLKGFHDLQYHDAAFTRAVMHPLLVGALTSVIGPNVQLHHTKMLVKPPERGAPFPMHQDYPFFPHRHHSVTAASVHLDDATEENGCLKVIPGSHKLGPIPEVGESRALDTSDYPLESGTSIPARAGDVLLFNYLTIHGSGVNASDRPRRNVLFQYRDPADEPLPREHGYEGHVNWGQGLMVAGHNPHWFERKPQFELRPPEEVAAGAAS